MATRYICECGKIQSRSGMRSEYDFEYDQLSCKGCGDILIDDLHGITYCPEYDKAYHTKVLFMTILAFTPFGIKYLYDNIEKRSLIWSVLSGMSVGTQLGYIVTLLLNL